MIVSQRIKLLRERLELTQAEFADSVGMSRPTLSQIEREKQLPTLEHLMSISKLYRVSVDDLLGVGNYRVNKTDVSAVAEHEVPYGVAHRHNDVDGRKGIPLVPMDAVGGVMGQDGTVLEGDIQHMFRIPTFTNVDFMIAVAGSSMYPKYNSGDVVACRVIRESSVIMWNRVYVLDTIENGVLIKRLRKGPDEETLLAVSDNKDYEPFNLPKTEVRTMALVIGVVRLE